MRRTLRTNGPAPAMRGLFAVSPIGRSGTGRRPDDGARRAHGEAPVGFGGYLRTGYFVEAVFENRERGSLSIGAMVGVSIFLRQRGLPGSKPVAAPHGATGG